MKISFVPLSRAPFIVSQVQEAGRNRMIREDD